MKHTNDVHVPEAPIRTAALALLLVAAAAAPLHAAFTETHLNEITAPVADYAAARIVALEALPAPTKAEKKELKLLRALSKRLSKTAFNLRQDFAELAAASTAQDQLGLAGAPMQTAADEMLRRANLSLSERVELGRDYLAELIDAKHRAAVQKKIDAVTKLRTAVAAATKAGKRGGLLVKANAAVTGLLKTADKHVLKDAGASKVPPTRWRSGDTIGFGGGRVAVPKDAISPIAGASIVFPVGHLASDVVVTIEPAASFVGGKDLPAGPALSVGPDATVVAGGATLYIPYQLPADTSAIDLALFAAGPPESKVFGGTPRADGTYAVNVGTLSTFQAGIAAPPPGQPGGTYRVQTLVLTTVLDPSGSQQPSSAGIVVGTLDQTVTFRPDHTASASVSGFPFVSRTFSPNLPSRHGDSAGSSLSGSSDFIWTPDGDGRFKFSLPLGTSAPAPMLAVASTDGRVIAWSGRGGEFEFLAVGIKTDPNTVTSQLAGRWAAVETGVQLLDDAAEPFRTRRHSAFRAFSVDALGAVTFETAGQRFETDVTYHSSDADPVHARAETQLADAGAETWTIAIGGRLSDAAGLRSGWFDPAAGVIVSTHYDSASRSVALMVAVRQPATSTPSAIPGLYHWAGLDVGTTVGAPDARSSAHEVLPAAGSLDVQSDTAATLATGDATRAAYTLTTQASPFRWLLSSAATAVPASSVPVTLALDAAGSHTAPADEFWYAFAGDGRYVLRMTRGEATRLARGIAIGLR